MTNRFTQLDDVLLRYVVAHGAREQPAQAALREATDRHPRGDMQISPDQAALLQMLVRLLGARRTIEVGVFTGYSALAVALALPEDGRILACDIAEESVRIGRPHWQAAGVAHKIDVRIAPAERTLDARIAAGESGQYDFAFIDADNTGYDTYYERCLQLLRRGGLVAIDNVLWGGDVVRPAPEDDADTAALQALNDKLAVDERVDLVMLTVGDGVTLARKR